MRPSSLGVTITNPDKLMYPAVGFTKTHVVEYYLAVSRYLLPHLKDRPVTLKRYPDGVGREFFYEKDAPTFTPKWVKTFPVPRSHGGPPIRYILVNDRRTLAWCANLASLELHPFLHRAPALDRPTSVVFDFDPGEGTDVLTCGRVALLVKDLLDRLELAAFVKVSGSKGLQLYVPLNTPVTYDTTQAFARTVAQFLEREHPDLVTSEMAKDVRPGRVFIDWSQNATHKTTIAVYSLRAKRERPFVSMPVTWDELGAALAGRDARGLEFEASAAVRRLAEVGDLFRPVLTRKQRLPQGFTEDGPAAAPRARAAPSSLQTYRTKRDFAQTPEPAPRPPRRSRQGSRRRFVIHKHAASRLHYDFRLEMHDVLKSWAVPKGPPYAANERRLAMATEDHPLEYLEFEGTIPPGQYGGGTVMVWDIGTYDVIDGDYYAGKLHLSLAGRKLRGEWVLVRDRRNTADGGDRKWLLIKVGSSMPALSPAEDDGSALTGRTMAQIAADNDAQWQSNRPAAPARPGRSARSETSAPPARRIDLDALPPAELAFVEPMRAKLVAELPAGGDWLYEIKFDGYRALAAKTGGAVRLWSRNGNVLNARFATIAAALAPLDDDTMLDGEIVALDAHGHPSFNLLKAAPPDAASIVFYAFDVLAYHGRDVRALPLTDRRELLKLAVAPLQEPIRPSETFTANPTDLVTAARAQGLEGLVAKRGSSRYEAGERSGAWAKVKLQQRQEFVIGGYIPGSPYFDALLVGYYEGPRLLFVAKVRNGFVPETREQLYRRLKPLETPVCPFANLPEPKSARRGLALTAEAMKMCRWLEPKLVAEVAFTDWTDGNHLRHARFVGLREDADPRHVIRERAA